MTPAITTYQVYLSIHILCAVLWVGGGTALVIQALRAQRARSPERLADIAAEAEWFGTRIFTPASLILVIFGFLLVARIDTLLLLVVVLDIALKPGL